jgi:DNA-binding response OmpR family regulator
VDGMMAKILLVDDDQIIREALSNALQLRNFEVNSLSDGRKVVSEIEENQYDIIVLDIVMPNKEGLETILDVRKINASIPILAVSGGGRTTPSSNLELAKMMGATDTMIKPFDSFTLIQKINKILKH